MSDPAVDLCEDIPLGTGVFSLPDEGDWRIKTIWVWGGYEVVFQFLEGGPDQRYAGGSVYEGNCYRDLNAKPFVVFVCPDPLRKGSSCARGDIVAVIVAEKEDGTPRTRLYAFRKGDRQHMLPLGEFYHPEE